MARPGLLNHPKFRRMRRLLGDLPIPHCWGYLECLWQPAYESGDAEIGDATDIELAAEWPGEPGQLFKALLECGGEGRAGFIEEVPGNPGRYQIHDLLENAPDYVRDRRRKVEERRNKDLHAKRPGHSGTRPGMSRTVPDASATPSPAPPIPEEHPRKDACSEPPKTAASEPPSPPMLMGFPTVGKPGGLWILTQAKIDEWAASFPAVDVLAECRKARQWCIDNPTRRKTANGMPAFLCKWLTREQNRAPALGPRIPCADTGPPAPDPSEAARRSVERVMAKRGAHVDG